MVTVMILLVLLIVFPRVTIYVLATGCVYLAATVVFAVALGGAALFLYFMHVLSLFI